MTSKPVLLRFEFDAFEHLSSNVDEVFETDMKQDTNGNCWRLQLYPGGCSDAVEEGMIAIILINVGDADVTAKFTVIVRNSLGHAVRLESNNAFHLFAKRGKRGFGYGYSDTRFMKRERILDKENGILVNGSSLHIDIAIEAKPHKEELYYPVAPVVPNMLKLFECGQDADVSFLVDGKIVDAHLPVLRANAPCLANRFKQGHKYDELLPTVQHTRLVARRHSHSSGCSIPSVTETESFTLVVDTSAEVLKLILRYVYAGVLPDQNTMLKLGTGLIEVAHQFEIFDFKMLVENALIEGCIFHHKNVVDYLLFAEANDCALLKEYAMDYFVLHVEDVLTSKYTKKLQAVPELMKEVLFAVAKSDKKAIQQSPVRLMTVSEMRKELAKEGLSVYGSKDVLLSRLEGSS